MFGLRSTYALSNILVAKLQQDMHFGYVQDDVKATARLTLRRRRLACAASLARIEPMSPYFLALRTNATDRREQICKLRWTPLLNARNRTTCW